MNVSTNHPLSPPACGGRPWLANTAIVLVFVSGVGVGAAGGVYWTRNQMLSVMRHPEQAADRFLPKLRSSLQLTEDQAKVVEEIVRRRYAAMETLRAESHPQLVAEFRAMVSEVSKSLTADQATQWVSLCDDVQEKYMPTAPIGPPPADFLFGRFDANQDGAISQDEAPPMMWLRLRQADADGDGKVTRQEFENARAR